MTEKQTDIEVTIEGLAAGGDGFAIHKGKPVYVPKTAAGERVRARITAENSEESRAVLQEIIIAGPDRITPPCGHYAACGSCSLQHISQEAYERWKAHSVKTTLERAGLEPEVFDPPVFMQAATRRRATFCARRTKTGLILGYNQTRSHLTQDITRCLVLQPDLDAKLQKLRVPLMAFMNPGDTLDVFLQSAEHGFDLVLTGKLQGKGRLSYAQNEALSAIIGLGITRISYREKSFGRPEILLSQGEIIKPFGELGLEIPPGAFLQASEEGQKTLVGKVLDYAGDSPGPIADLFCGVGTFTGHLLMKASQLYATDSDDAAIKALKKACSVHKGYGGIEVERRDLFKDPLTAIELSRFDTVVLDPPRAGASAQVQNLAQSEVKKIVYVSCNPATFARDGKALKAGGYTLRRLALVDQFVYTPHTEVVGLFTRA